jgi:acyl-CoA synthetase (AMP-forming)/AMP-acid ligase II
MSMRAVSLGFYDLLQQLRSGHPDKAAAITGERRLTYAELVDRTDRLTSVLHDRGIGAGNRVLWLGQNSHHVLELLVACARLGALLCPANWRQSADELRFLLADVDPQLVVWQEAELGERVAVLHEALPGTQRSRWLAIDGEDGYEHLIRDAAPTLTAGKIEAGSGLLMLYTAAFSGRPAGAVLSQQGLYLQGVAHIPVLETRHDDVNLVATPLFHILAWISLLPVLISGGTNIFLPRPDPEEVRRAITDLGATTGPIMPPTALEVAELNSDRQYDFSGFRSALPIPGWKEMTADGTTVSGYGQTETSGPILLPLPGAELSGPIQGRPSPLARVRVVDENGRDVPVGETGEILVAGPTVTSGYWNRPEVNAERSSDGWWRTRDLGRRDPDGVITFVGPKLRMIKSGGENIYPAEVECCLEAHPGVLSAALIGCPDKAWGQLVTAVVVRRPESDVDAAKLIAYAREKLAAYKTPRTVHFVEEMPMAASGKDYAELDARFSGGNYPGTN